MEIFHTKSRKIFVIGLLSLLLLKYILTWPPRDFPLGFYLQLFLYLVL